MADVTANATVVYEAGTAEKVVLYLVKKVDTNDTLDVSAKFGKLTAAVSLGAGSASPKADVCAVATTIVTLDVATAVDETLYVLVIGDAV